jgi:hypothetical protein
LVGIKVSAGKGTPELLAAAASGAPFATVTVDVNDQPPEFWVHMPATITLRNAVVASIDTSVGGSAIPTTGHTLIFSFDVIEMANVGSWDFTRNTGTRRPPTPDFTLGLDDPGFRIKGFQPAPQDGAGNFGDATMSGLAIPDALQEMFLVARRAAVPSRTVHLFGTNTTPPTEVAQYGFSSVSVHSVAVGRTGGTETFNAASYQWTYGDDVATYP